METSTYNEVTYTCKYFLELFAKLCVTQGSGGLKKKVTLEMSDVISDSEKS